MSNTKRGFGGVGIIVVILIMVGVGAYLWNKKSAVPLPSTNVPADNSFKTLPDPTAADSCDEYIISYNREDGRSISQKVNLGGKDYEINSHIEAEDNWTSFTVDGEIGPIGQYYNSLAPNLGNPLTVKGANLTDSLGRKLPFLPDTIVIKGISITLKKIGYTDNRQEFAEACLNRI